MRLTASGGFLGDCSAIITTTCYGGEQGRKLVEISGKL